MPRSEGVGNSLSSFGEVNRVKLVRNAPLCRGWKLNIAKQLFDIHSTSEECPALQGLET